MSKTGTGILPGCEFSGLEPLPRENDAEIKYPPPNERCAARARTLGLEGEILVRRSLPSSMDAGTNGFFSGVFARMC
jgi:hypothetical protein